MAILDPHRLAEVAGQASKFLNTRPYPWLNVQGALHEEAFRRLSTELPDFALFKADFGNKRGYGQQSHDRYLLSYTPQLDPALPAAWREFLAEIHGPEYQNFLRRIYGLGRHQRFALSLQWHFAPTGASVSPHTDVKRKIGSHIFYLNTEDDWNAGWGGQTLVLDDDGKLGPNNAPAFGSLPEVASSIILGNRSFIFKRTDHAWHAVNPITCPPDRMRKVFIVVANKVNLQVLWRRLRGMDPNGDPLPERRDRSTKL
jgi:hypothetical protein